jgi:hypothetical protein
MPPKAAAEVAVEALVELAVLPPPDPPEDELLQAAASSATPLTAAATVNNFLVGTCFPLRTAKPPGTFRHPGQLTGASWRAGMSDT